MSSNPEMTGVELPAIDFLKHMGYQYRKASDIELEVRTQAPILKDQLKTALQKINPWLSDSGVHQVLVELRKDPHDTLMESNQHFWTHFIAEKSCQVNHTIGDKQSKKSVSLIDTVNIENNEFCVVNQFIGKNAGGEEYRPDILLFVNGLPMATIECKAAHRKVEEGIGQLIGYQNHFRKHFQYNQVCAAINRVDGKYGAINTPSQFYFDFLLNDEESAQVDSLVQSLEQDSETEPNAQQKLLWALFQPSRFIELIRFFVLFEYEGDRLIKKLPRYQQWRAVQKCIERIHQDQGGVVWHTQGSGKSLTMGMLARQLRAEESGLKNPSVLLLTDRTDLDRQIFNTFKNIGLKCERAHSVAGLKERLANDYGGIFTSTIQKFQEDEKEEAKHNPELSQWKGRDKKVELVDNEEGEWFHEFYERVIPEENARGKLNGRRYGKAEWKLVKTEKLTTRYRRIEENNRWMMVAEEVNFEGVWEEKSREEVNFEVLSNKSNLYVLVDEAHRSHYGFLGAFMRASLPKAKLIAFTGTPLLKEEKNTLGEFGGEEYIDVYALQQAVQDGFTLPIKLSDGIPKLVVSRLLDADFEEKTKGLPETKIAQMKERLIKERRIAPSRLREIAKHMVDHYEANAWKKGFKAMLVCSGRKAAVKYKEILDEIMRDRQSEGKTVFDSKVVISLGSITANRTGGKVGQSKTGLDDDDHEYFAEELSIEERVREAVRKGETPIAVPSEEIPHFTIKLFKLPFGDESENKDNDIKFNNTAILIVSDMLLTGYDAPILSTLYLDKPLKEHTLLQAIARVNRTRSGKNAGYIVDYYGVVDDLDAALKMYGGDVKREHVLQDVDSEIPKVEATNQAILNLLPKKHDLLKEEEAYKNDAELYLDPEKRLDKCEDFLELFEKFSKSLDIILPNPKGYPFKAYFLVYGQLKASLRHNMKDSKHQEKLYASDSALLDELMEEHIKTDPIMSFLGKEVDIFNTADLAQLKSISTDKAALTMKNQLRHTIKVGMEKDPGFFGSLEIKLNELIDDEIHGRIEQTDFLKQLDALTQQIHNKNNQAIAHGFTCKNSIAIFNYLNSQVPAFASSVTEIIIEEDVISNTLNSPKWQDKAGVVHELEKEIRKHLKGVSGWNGKIAKDHSQEIVKILSNA